MIFVWNVVTYRELRVGAYSAFNRNEYQKQKNGVSNE
jgi:hypothetical protein